jgi:hypothetical protein
MGLSFYSLDQYPLTFSHILTPLSRLFGGSPRELPHPETDYVKFEAMVKATLDKSPKVWDPVEMRDEKWINLPKLRSTYKAGGGCTIA